MRRHRAKIDCRRLRCARLVHNHKSDPAEPAVPGLKRGERKCGRNRGIDSGTARRQDLGAHRRRGAALRSDEASLRGCSGFADLPVLAQMHGPAVTRR